MPSSWGRLEPRQDESLPTRAVREGARLEADRLTLGYSLASEKDRVGATLDASMHGGGRMLRRVMGFALITMSSLVLAAPVSAGAPGGMSGGGSRSGGFHGGGFHHHHAFHRFGCCSRPGVAGSVPFGAPASAQYYAYPNPVYAAPPAYGPSPAHQAPPPAAHVPPVASPVFCHVGGCFHLQGDGVSVPYQWVWVPSAPAMPPPPPEPPRI
jgi:hypothetical protein